MLDYPQILAALSAELASCTQGRIEIREDLPVGPTGKILKRKLRESLPAISSEEPAHS